VLDDLSVVVGSRGDLLGTDVISELILLVLLVALFGERWVLVDCWLEARWECHICGDTAGDRGAGADSRYVQLKKVFDWVWVGRWMLRSAIRPAVFLYLPVCL
jgi:hypothetical protein